MSRLEILTEAEQTEFDYPPTLTVETKAICFAINNEVECKINLLRGATNKVGFLLQYAYFKGCKRFFITNRFRQEDIEYAARLLGESADEVNIFQYIERTPANHQKTILELMEYKNYLESQDWLKKEITRMVDQLTNPRQLFFDVLQLLHDHHIELPSYHRLAKLITKYYLGYEERLLKIIKRKITKKAIKALDKLLEADKSGSRGVLGAMKIINQSIKPKAIKASINMFLKIEGLYKTLQPLIKVLNLTPNSCNYYAIWVQKAKLSQLKQFPNIGSTGICAEKFRSLSSNPTALLRPAYSTSLPNTE